MIPLGLHSGERVKGVEISHLQPMYGAKNPRATACAQQRLVRLPAHPTGDTVLSGKKRRLFSLYLAAHTADRQLLKLAPKYFKATDRAVH